MMSVEPAEIFCQVSNARFEQPWTTFYWKGWDKRTSKFRHTGTM